MTTCIEFCTAAGAFQNVVVTTDVSCSDEDGLRAVMTAVRAAQRRLDGLVTRVGIRSDALAAAGRSVPAGEMSRSGGAVGSAQARREAGRARAAADNPGLGEAMSSGETTGEHADVIARHTSDLTPEQIGQLDVPGLIEKAKTVPVETFARLVKRAVDDVTTDHGRADAVKKRKASEFRHWFDEESGMGRFCGQLDPERYESLTSAVDQHMRSLAAASDGSVTVDRHLAAEALVGLVTGAGELKRRTPSVTVIVDHDTVVHGVHGDSVRETQDGREVPPETIARLCCDAVVRKVVLGTGGKPINVGAEHRTATAAQWAAMKAVYRSCAWDGCRAPISWCQLHHIHHWEHGGPTDLCNLVPLCSEHHHSVHEGKWSLKLLDDRRLEIYKPDRSLFATVETPSRCCG